ncbi:hypothetical protein CYY_000338 [Polysphondylium violaceum]|uniref:Nitronate monooxygenase domain-containing protein n=1 Tax=Polysphondylium violaceum TaxID=133409 RepID=A0A8J4Q4Y6_9MYCE|nr:hypothetical protein CYY_000338 [Polysphondylium violaceum]
MGSKKVLRKLLNVKYPIIQAPMLGVTSPEMVAAATHSGILGSLPIGGVAVDKANLLIEKTKTLTANKPFAVNLFAHSLPNPFPSDGAIEQVENWIGKSLHTGDLAYRHTSMLDRLNKADSYTTYEQQIDLLLHHDVKIVSFTFGIPSDAVIERLRRNNVLLIGTCTSLEEALALEEKGIRVIVAQSAEAGGHRGSFIKDVYPEIGALALLPCLSDNLKRETSIVASGGIFDARTTNACFLLGASGVQLGSLFIGSHESLAIPSYKESLAHAKQSDIVTTDAYSGRYARGINNQFIKDFAHSEMKALPYPVQNSLTTPLRSLSQKENNNNFTNMWAGQSCRNSPINQPTSVIIKNLIDKLGW